MVTIINVTKGVQVELNKPILLQCQLVVLSILCYYCYIQMDQCARIIVQMVIKTKSGLVKFLLLAIVNTFNIVVVCLFVFFFCCSYVFLSFFFFFSFCRRTHYLSTDFVCLKFVRYNLKVSYSSQIHVPSIINNISYIIRTSYKQDMY